MGRVLLAGVPRSGTSWTGAALGKTAGTTYVDEPDGFRGPYALKVMLHRGENPELAPGTPAIDYERLWIGAFAGGAMPRDVFGRLGTFAYQRAGVDARRAARAGEGMHLWVRIAVTAARPRVAVPESRNILVKSVQCARSIEWIDEHFAPQVVVLRRNPLNTVASWRDLDFVRNPRETADLVHYAKRVWNVDPPESSDQLALQAFTVGVLSTALASAARRHPAWTVVSHDELCLDASTQLRGLAEDLGLVWTDEAEEYVLASNHDGSGYLTNRVTSAQPDRWRDRLSSDEIDTIRRVLDAFPDGAHVGR
jgi:hypothetical protein